jgi:hypothetical protein
LGTGNVFPLAGAPYSLHVATLSFLPVALPVENFVKRGTIRQTPQPQHSKADKTPKQMAYPPRAIRYNGISETERAPRMLIARGFVLLTPLFVGFYP